MKKPAQITITKTPYEELYDSIIVDDLFLIRSRPKDLKDTIDFVLQNYVSDKERNALITYFGLNEDTPRPRKLADCAKDMGTTKCVLSNIISNGRHQLQHRCHTILSTGLSEYSRIVKDQEELLQETTRGCIHDFVTLKDGTIMQQHVYNSLVSKYGEETIKNAIAANVWYTDLHVSSIDYRLGRTYKYIHWVPKKLLLNLMSCTDDNINSHMSPEHASKVMECVHNLLVKFNITRKQYVSVVNDTEYINLYNSISSHYWFGDCSDCFGFCNDCPNEYTCIRDRRV